MHPELFVALSMKLAALVNLAAGTYAIQDPRAPLSIERATQYAFAATYHGERAGVDPYELIAVARNESDFIENMRGPDGKDCGLTQTRVTITKYSCRQLRQSYWLAFQEAARELQEYGNNCLGHADFDRCRLNRYNSGVHYAKRGYHGAYWLRVRCFEHGARNGIDMGETCRHVVDGRGFARALRLRPRWEVAAANARNPSS
jgi:hypothetical protein